MGVLNETRKFLLKFGDGDWLNLCRVKKVDVSSTFIDNLFRSGLTFAVPNDIITIKIEKKKKMLKPQVNKQTKRSFKKKLGCQMDIRETNSDHEMEKR